MFISNAFETDFEITSEPVKSKDSLLGMVAGTLLIERVNGVADIFDPDNVRLGLAVLALAGTLVEGGAGYLGVFTQRD